MAFTYKWQGPLSLVALAGLGSLTGCLPPPAPRPAYYATVPVLPPPRVAITDGELVPNQALFFEFDQDRILPISYPILDEITHVLRTHPEIYLLRIEGHTDDRGSPAYNLNLSYRRSLAVQDYLEQHGVSASRMRAVGFGQSQPIADNHTEQGRAQNRRVTFVIQERGRQEARR